MTELRLAPHSLLDRKMIEIWHDGRFVGSVYALDDGAGVQITTKHRLIAGKVEQEIVGLLHLASIAIKIQT